MRLMSKAARTETTAILQIFILIFLMISVSCEKKKEITPAVSEKLEIKTTSPPVEVVEEEEGIPKGNSSISILSPSVWETIIGENVNVRLNVSNFKLVLAGVPVRKKEGYVRVQFDSMEQEGHKTEFLFGNIPAGKHSLTAELMKSNRSSFEPRIMQTIEFITKSNEEIKKELSVRKAAVEADDDSFYPYYIYITRGEPAEITFTTRSENVYYAGLEYRSQHFTASSKPGESVKVVFTANDDFKVSSYWPTANVKKSELLVIVEG